MQILYNVFLNAGGIKVVNALDSSFVCIYFAWIMSETYTFLC